MNISLSDHAFNELMDCLWKIMICIKFLKYNDFQKDIWFDTNSLSKHEWNSIILAIV